MPDRRDDNDSAAHRVGGEIFDAQRTRRIGVLGSRTIGIALAAALAGSTLLTASQRISSAAGSYDADTFQPMWILEWHGCSSGPQPSCLPSFHKVAEGRFRFLGCSDFGWCIPVTYEYWDERDNRGYSGPHAWDAGDPRAP